MKVKPHIIIKIEQDKARAIEAVEQFGEFPVHYCSICKKCGKPYGLHYVLVCPSLKEVGK